MTPVDLEQPEVETADQARRELDAALDAAQDLAGEVDSCPDMGLDLDEVLNAASRDEEIADNPVKYDFHRPHHISRPFQDNLQAAADYFAKNGTIEFTSRLRLATDLTYTGLRQGNYAEFVQDLPRPTCVAMVEMPPLKGPALLNLDLGLCFVFMKKLLGGQPEAELAVRDFTEIERGIAADLMERFVELFGKAMSKIIPIQTRMTGLENNPHYLGGIAEGSSLVILEFMIRLEGVEGPVQWAIPLSAFGPVRDIFDPSDAKETRSSEELKGDRRKILDMVQGCGSELVVLLGQFETNLENILNLSEGDVLDLPQGVDAPLKVQIAGQDAWLAQPGRVGNQRAINLIQQLTKE